MNDFSVEKCLTQMKKQHTTGDSKNVNVVMKWKGEG